jgi:tetratricopeptide (TPR) repeat protein
MDEAERDIQKVVGLAKLFMEQGNPTRALEILDKATGDIHAHWRYWYYRAWALERLKRFTEGMETARRGLWVAPEEPALFWMLALHQDGAGQIDHARGTLWRGLQRHPDNIFLLTESAWLAARLWKWEEANQYQQRAEQIDPAGRMIRRNQLRLAALRNDTAEIRRVAKVVLAEEPENSLALYLLGVVAANAGSLGEAEKQLRRAVLSDPAQQEIAEETRNVRLMRHPLLYPLTVMRKVKPIPLIAAFIIVEEWFRQSGQTDIAVAVTFGFVCWWQYTFIASLVYNLLRKWKRP